MEVPNITWDTDPCIFIFKEEVAGKTKMHVKHLDISDWVRIDKSYCSQIEAKKELYKSYMADIFVSRSDDESTELCKWEFFELLIQHLLARFPNIFEMKGEDYIVNKVTQEVISIKKEGSSEDPLLRAGKLTQDDWIILQYDTDLAMYVLTAGVLCFPSDWSLREKFNKPMDAIHEPVKPYTEHLKEKVNKLFVRMKPEKPMWRANWGIFSSLKDTTDLFIHPNRQLHRVGDPDSKLPFEGELTGKKLYLRCEYQTLKKLPRTGAMVFGIRTYMRHLEDLKHHPNSTINSLLESIETLDEEFLSYKGGDIWKDATVQYLKLLLSQKENELKENSSCFSMVSLTTYMKYGGLTVALLSLLMCARLIKR